MDLMFVREKSTVCSTCSSAPSTSRDQKSISCMPILHQHMKEEFNILTQAQKRI